jgi:hypothetical protein
MSGYGWQMAERAGSAVILDADQKWRQSLSEPPAPQNSAEPPEPPAAQALAAP